ncbi:hypothetical protein ACUN24_10680 [Pedobacter sp. WC2501]|uniref:hypothetical protein n=1 Tax=Pedobacter sp. WC2501 TaxID=3461400 RepID=UPI00404658FD
MEDGKCNTDDGMGSAVICEISVKPLTFCSRRFKKIGADEINLHLTLCALCLFFVISVVKNDGLASRNQILNRSRNFLVILMTEK